MGEREEVSALLHATERGRHRLKATLAEQAGKCISFGNNPTQAGGTRPKNGRAVSRHGWHRYPPAE